MSDAASAIQDTTVFQDALPSFYQQKAKGRSRGKRLLALWRRTNDDERCAVIVPQCYWWLRMDDNPNSIPILHARGDSAMKMASNCKLLSWSPCPPQASMVMVMIFLQPVVCNSHIVRMYYHQQLNSNLMDGEQWHNRVPLYTALILTPASTIDPITRTIQTWISVLSKGSVTVMNKFVLDLLYATHHRAHVSSSNIALFRWKSCLDSL